MSAPEGVDKLFAASVKKSRNQADQIESGTHPDPTEMDTKDEPEKPSIPHAIVNKAGTLIEKITDVVSDIAHKVTNPDKALHEEPMAGSTKEEAEFYAERASQKYDGNNSVTSPLRNYSKPWWY